MRFVCSLLLLFLSVPSAWAETFRTPPLSEWNFDISYTEQGLTSVVLVEDDLEWDLERSYGTVSYALTVGTDNGHKPLFICLSPAWFIIDPHTGAYSGISKETGTAYVGVRYGPLIKRIPLPISGNGTMAYKTGSLGRHIYDAITGLLEGKTVSDTTQNIFINRVETTGVYQWNPDGWAYPVDLTCMAPWRDKGGVGSSDASNYHWPVTAVTPRHIVCGHVGTWIGEKYHFFTRDNQVVEREIIAKSRFVADQPYYVAVLNEDLPSSIRPAKLLPYGVNNYILNARVHPIPVIATDQEKKALSNPVYQIIENVSGVSKGVIYCLSDSEKFPFSEPIIGGDSSSPVYTVVNGETVLLTSWYTKDYGLGYHAYLSEIKDTMDELHGGTSPYYPEVVDLSGFMSFD